MNNIEKENDLRNVVMKKKNEYIKYDFKIHKQFGKFI